MSFPDFSTDPTTLQEALQLKGTGVEDAWCHTTLPSLLHGRSPAYLTQPELSRVMSWKLRTGKNRPGLQKYVDALTDKEVRAASEAAFACLPVKGAGSLKDALTQLSKLKGVGPATASAVLSFWCPEKAAFMSDESLEGIVGSRKYTLQEGLALTTSCAKKAKELGGTWTAGSVQRAVWASAIVAKLGGKDGAGKGGRGSGSGSGGGSGKGGSGGKSGKKRSREE